MEVGWILLKSEYSYSGFLPCRIQTDICLEKRDCVGLGSIGSQCGAGRKLRVSVLPSGGPEVMKGWSSDQGAILVRQNISYISSMCELTNI